MELSGHIDAHIPLSWVD